MELYIDSANVKEIKRLCDLYPIDGVTTNPTILARENQNPIPVLKEIRAIIGDDSLLFAQAIPKDADGMLRDAHALIKLLGENTVIKLPAVPEGFKAIRILNEEGILTCATLVYTPLQAYLAAKAGADYVAPYVNRIDNMGYDGTATVMEIQDILNEHGYETKVLAASFRNSQQVLSLCAYGIESATCSPAVIDAFVKNREISGALDDFIDDFAKISDGAETMADLID